MRHTTKWQRGDTLVEVLLATVILSVVITGAITMMNRGHAMARDSLERTQVTALMAGQAQMLHYIRDNFAKATSDTERSAYPASLWPTLVGKGGNIEPACKAAPQSFYLKKGYDGSGNTVVSVENFNQGSINTGSADFVKTYAKPNEGMWIEAETPATSASGVDYIDFHIKGCWQGNAGGPLQESITIVRLYSPGALAVNAPTPWPSIPSPTPDPGIPAACSGGRNDIALIIDISRSMLLNNWSTNPPITREAKMKQVMSDFVDNIGLSPDGNHAALVMFNHDAYLKQNFTSNTSALKSQITSATTDWGTDYVDALEVTEPLFASSNIPPLRPTSPKVMVFVSDGRNDEGDDIVRTITNRMKASGNIKIYTILVGSDSDAGLLQEMAGNGGTFENVRQASEWDDFMDEIADSLGC